MTSQIVVDSSAGVEIAADTATGRALGRLIPPTSRLYVPEHFYAECGAVLRKWGNGKVLTDVQLASAIGRLLRLPVQRVQLRDLFRAAWVHRHNVTFADALYVVLAEQLDAPLLTGDRKLAAAATLSVQMLHLSAT